MKYLYEWVNVGTSGEWIAGSGKHKSLEACRETAPKGEYIHFFRYPYEEIDRDGNLIAEREK